ncbi:MAG: aminotransferase class III-fold pyridoxal phosphate-dependent enzyme, partial [Pseudomonadales bacterium]
LYRDGSFIENAAEKIGPHLQAKLKQFVDHPIVGEVRGLGMFAAIELVRDKSSREPLAPEAAAAVYCRDHAVANGLMVRATGDAMIMSPPLVCSVAEIDLLIERLGSALDMTAKHYNVS